MMTMDVIEKPASEAEAATIIAAAHQAGTPLEIVGGGTKRTVGKPVNAASCLSAEGMSGIVAYEPSELVLTAKAGTPLREITETLDKAGQQLPFEPADWRGLLGSVGEPTIGAVAATNNSGPRRFVSGAARDSLLGVRVVNGKGEIVRNGGRVMKNVTGLDLVKLMAGSWGTLGLLTEVTFKVLPKRQTETTILVHGLDDMTAAAAMARVMATPAEVSGAAHLPDIVSGTVLKGALKGSPVTALRIEGFAESVTARIPIVEKAIGPGADLTRLSETQSRALWRDIRDVVPFADGTERAVWKVSVAPMAGARLVDAFRREAGCLAFYDWQGGLVWLRMEADAEADVLRAIMRKLGGGHATLVRAAPAVRAAIPVFEPQPKPLADLSARIRAAFDPAGILNPGRMGA